MHTTVTDIGKAGFLCLHSSCHHFYCHKITSIQKADYIVKFTISEVQAVMLNWRQQCFIKLATVFHQIDKCFIKLASISSNWQVFHQIGKCFIKLATVFQTEVLHHVM